MGKTLIQKYKEDVSREVKLAVLSTILIGLLIHGYKFSNALINHDSLYNFYSTQNVVGSGRWFLTIACGISSYFDLPWVIGILSLVWIGLTAAIIVKLFEVKNPVLIVLIGGILASFPGITNTFHYGFTADGYMLAMFLAALSVYISNLEHKGIKWSVFSVLLICITCGIYQAYVSFGLLLTIFYFIKNALENKYSNKEYVRYIVKQMMIYMIALILYYVIWKICLSVQNIEVGSYQGIDQVNNLGAMEFGLGWFIQGMKNSIQAILMFFLEWNIFEHGLTLYGGLNIAILAFLAAGLLYLIIKNKIYKKKLRLFLIVASLFLCIPCACMWIFASLDMVYRPMMLVSLAVVYIFCGVIFDQHMKEKVSTVLAVVLCVMIFNNGLIANISYYFMNKCYEQTYATGVELTMRIHEMKTEHEFDNIAVVGKRDIDIATEIVEEGADKVHTMVQLLVTDLLHDQEHVELFLQEMLHINETFVTEEEKEELEKNIQIQEMDKWPSYDSVQMVEDTLVIKIGDIKELGRE